MGALRKTLDAGLRRHDSFMLTSFQIVIPAQAGIQRL
jgi:hypothetical protein